MIAGTHPATTNVALSTRKDASFIMIQKDAQTDAPLQPEDTKGRDDVRPVSRVLSEPKFRTVISLGVRSPARSSSQPAAS